MALSAGLHIFLVFFFLETYLVSVDLKIIDVENTRVVLYYGPTYHDSKSYKLSEVKELIKSTEFRHNKTTLFIPDYHEPQLSDTHNNVMAYNKLNKINFIMLDWGAPMTNKISQLKEPNVRKLTPLLADWMLTLHKQTNWKGFHVLAYAKGCEVAGTVARSIMLKTNGKVRLPRLTALDPPKAYFQNGRVITVITPNLADFVDAIHTDSGSFGSSLSVGHVDFWPNGAHNIQPGCIFEEYTCSRKRSWAYWAESVYDQTGPQFCAYLGKNYLTFFGIEAKPITMGINCPKTARGNYFLSTNSQYPYAKGCEKHADVL